MKRSIKKAMKLLSANFVFVAHKGKDYILNLKVGESKEINEFELTEEGHNDYTTIFHNDGKEVTKTVYYDSEDCDGRYHGRREYVCRLCNLHSHIYDGVTYPVWEKDTRWR